MSLTVKVKFQRLRSPGTKKGIFGPFGSLLWFMFGKNIFSLTLSYHYYVHKARGQKG